MRGLLAEIAYQWLSTTDCDTERYVKCRTGCGAVYRIPLSSSGLFRHENRMISVQDAYPHLHPADRELFVTGTCRRCWARMCGPDPDAGFVRRVLRRVRRSK